MKNSWFLKQLEWQIIGNLFLRVAPFLLLSFQIASRFMEWANDLTIEPYLINHGFRLYADIANQHNPLLTYLLAFLYQVFGYDTYWKVLFLLIIGILTGLIVKHLAEKTNGKFAGILAIWLFAMLWPSYGGNLFWFDTFLPLLYLGSLMFILYYQGKYYTWIAGGGMGIAFLTKQHAIFILPILLFGLLTRENTQQSPHSNERTKNISRFIIGFIIPIILWLAIEGANGNLEQSMYWTFTYNLFGPYRQLGSLLPEKSDVFNLGLWLAPGLLLCALLCYNTKDRSLRTRLLFLLTIGVTSMSTIFPRYSNLHLAPSIPAFSIAFGVAVSWVFDRLNFGATNRTINRLATGMVSVLLIGAINPLIAIPNMKNFESIFERQEVNAPPSPECLVLYIEKNTKPSEQIYVLAFGYEGIYFDSGRLPAGKVWQALEWYSILPQFRSDILTLIDEKKPKMFLLSARNNMPYSVDLVSHQMIVAHLLRAGYTTGLDCAQTEVWER